MRNGEWRMANEEWRMRNWSETFKKKNDFCRVFLSDRAAFESISDEYTKRISSLSGTQLTMEKV